MRLRRVRPQKPGQAVVEPRSKPSEKIGVFSLRTTAISSS